MKKKSKFDDLWEIDICVICGGKLEDAVKVAGFTELAKDVEMEGFVVTSGRQFFIWISKPYNHSRFAKIFQHEFTHLVNVIYKEHGATPPIDHDELDARWRAGLAEFISNTCRN